jgi:hypothetical protein
MFVRAFQPNFLKYRALNNEKYRAYWVAMNNTHITWLCKVKVKAQGCGVYWNKGSNEAEPMAKDFAEWKELFGFLFILVFINNT